jgi:hypothetical protein
VQQANGSCRGLHESVGTDGQRAVYDQQLLTQNKSKCFKIKSKLQECNSMLLAQEAPTLALSYSWVTPVPFTYRQPCTYWEKLVDPQECCLWTWWVDNSSLCYDCEGKGRYDRPDLGLRLEVVLATQSSQGDMTYLRLCSPSLLMRKIVMEVCLAWSSRRYLVRYDPNWVSGKCRAAFTGSHNPMKNHHASQTPLI